MSVKHPAEKTAGCYTMQSVPQTTNTKTILLVVIVPVEVLIIVVEVSVPCVVCIVLRGTPPVTVVSNVVECSIVVTVTAGEAGKSCHFILLNNTENS
jgi:hypothetical protein